MMAHQVLLECPDGLRFADERTNISLTCQEDGNWTQPDQDLLICRIRKSVLSMEFSLRMFYLSFFFIILRNIIFPVKFVLFTSLLRAIIIFFFYIIFPVNLCFLLHDFDLHILKGDKLPVNWISVWLSLMFRSLLGKLLKWPGYYLSLWLSPTNSIYIYIYLSPPAYITDSLSLIYFSLHALCFSIQTPIHF